MGGSPALPRLYLITDRTRTRGRDLVSLLREAVRGGVRMIQLREKDLPPDELRDLAVRIRRVVTDDTLLLVNSSVAVARTLKIGLHLPAAAAPPPGLRAVTLRGRSVHDEAEARRAHEEGVDYVLAGPVHPTASKPGHPGSGVGLIRDLREVLGSVPLYAIGGITVAGVPAAIHAGAHGVAVCGAILGSNDPRRVAEGLCLALEVASAAGE